MLWSEKTQSLYPMSKYTSAGNTGKTAWRVYKFNRKLKFVYTDRAFQPKIKVMSQNEADISRP